VDEGRVNRAIALTAEKYCSASIMLESAGVAISHTFEIKGSN
jgi:putative redox protein